MSHIMEPVIEGIGDGQNRQASQKPYRLRADRITWFGSSSQSAEHPVDFIDSSLFGYQFRYAARPIT